MALQSSITSLSLCPPISHYSPGTQIKSFTPYWALPGGFPCPLKTIWICVTTILSTEAVTWSYSLTPYIWWFRCEGVPHLLCFTRFIVLKCSNLILAWGPLLCSFFFLASCLLLAYSSWHLILIWNILIEALLVWSPDLWLYITLFFSILLLSLSSITTLSSCSWSPTTLLQLGCQHPEQGFVCMDHSTGPELGLEKSRCKDHPLNFLNVPYDSPSGVEAKLLPSASPLLWVKCTQRVSCP